MANKMTPRERVAATIGGKKPDKLPIMVANSNTFICQYYGISVEDFCFGMFFGENWRYLDEYYRGYIIDKGRILYHGTVDELNSDEKVKDCLAI